MTADLSRTDIETRLWREIEKVRYGMLGVVGDAPLQHFQPMTPFLEAETGTIWFFTRDDTDLAKAAAGEGAQAMFTIQSKDNELQACIGGRLTQDHDRVRIDKYWNAVVAAWYPEGKDDPRLTLLRLDGEDAAVWLSEQGPLKFAYEIAKANLTKTEPDVGERATIDLDRPGA